MVILAGVLIIGLVIWMSRAWVNGSGRSQAEEESLQTRPSSVLYSSNPTSFILDPTTAGDTGSNNSSSFPDSAPSSDNVTGTHDCAPDSGNDNSSADCPCPADSTSYDAGGCTVDFNSSNSSSFDSGSSN
jgi:hypothetical protein